MTILRILVDSFGVLFTTVRSLALHILSRDVLRRIREGDVVWESMVPPEVGEVIKSRQFFGYRIPHAADRSAPKAVGSGIGA
jgi:hypothetical protein